MINPVALAKKLQAGDHPFSKFLLDNFSAKGRDGLAALLNDGADPDRLAEILAEEFNGIAAGGQSVYLADKISGTKLRKSTRKLVKRNPQGSDLERMNSLLIQDFFSGDIDHDSCELAEVVKKKKIEFRIYKERRRLKTKWNESFKITFPAIDGQTSTHAPSLEQAYVEIDTLVDRILSGETPVTKQQNKERDAKAKVYDEIAVEVAKVGKKELKDIVEFIKDAVKAQLKIGVDRPLLEFVIYAVKILAEPVKRCFLQAAVNAFKQFAQARKDVDKRAMNHVVAVVKEFAAAMPLLVHQRGVANLPPGTVPPAPPKDIFVDDPEPNDVQAWLNSRKIGWRSRRGYLDIVRGFLAYCRDALHALPPSLKTAAHVVPRTKPDSDMKPVPAPVLAFEDVWRLFVNLQDLETVWFFALAVFAGLHQSEILRLVWENDIIWKDGKPIQVFIASGNGKDKHGKRMGAFVKVQGPLSPILALGRGRTGKIVLRGSLQQEKLAVFARRLNIAWAESIMRHTFASNLLASGWTFESVAGQLRNTVTILKRHYYAPLSELEVEWCFRLPIAIDRFAKLPFQKRFWNWDQFYEFKLLPFGTPAIKEVPADPSTTAEKKRELKKREARIVWPDPLELQVMLWDKSQAVIARGLKCRHTTVSRHAAVLKLKVPDPGHWMRVKHGIPVEIPEEILKAREALERRKKADAKEPADSSVKSRPTGPQPDDKRQKPAPEPEDPQSGINAVSQEK
jgi:integrase